MTTVDGSIRCLVLPQGHWGDATGEALVEVLARLLETDAKFLRQFPTAAPFYHTRWRVTTRRADETKPSFGYERYDIQDDGTLGPRVTNWYSGD